MPFRLGAFVIAANAGAAVVPITQTGSRALLPGVSLRPHHGTLQVLIGERLTPQGKDWLAALRLRDAARHWILARLDEPESAGEP